MFRIEHSLCFRSRIAKIFSGVELIRGFTVGGFSERLVGEGPISLAWLLLEWQRRMKYFELVVGNRAF